jgi:hypothetical protein
MYATDRSWAGVDVQDRRGEEGSRVVICRVEDDAKFGQIAHIHVNGLRMEVPHVPDGPIEEVGHMPYAADALRGSLVAVESMGDIPAFENGYRQWRDAFERGKAGVWTAPVAEAIAGLEAGMNR